MAGVKTLRARISETESDTVTVEVQDGIIAMLRATRLIFNTIPRSQYLLEGVIGRRWTAAHTLAVRQKIDEKRKQAMKAGGKTRIASQHKKVSVLLTFC